MRVVLVEDEPGLAASLAEGLRADGHRVAVAHDGAAGLAAVAAEQPDVVVLDRDLPVLGGDAVCRALVSTGNPARILMLTAAATVGDRVAGLDLGADDYLTKPFAYVELLARLRSLGRRGGTGSAAPVLERAGIRLDTTRRCAERDGRPLRLTPKELAVLEVLLVADGGYLTAEDLLDEAWEGRAERDRTVVKAAVYGLRGKLGTPSVVESSPGLGYRIP